MTAYSTLLKDPRWQKKRLKILERDKWKCRLCEDSESTLHVHHCYYDKSMKPWEYEESSLLTLCYICHQEESESYYSEKNALTDALSRYGFVSWQFNALACCVYEYWLTKGTTPHNLKEIVQILMEGVKDAQS